MKKNLPLRLCYALLLATAVQSAFALPSKTPPLISKESRKADVKVSGNVTDDNGEPLPGVSIIVKGTAKGTSTDANGNYNITVPQNSILIFQYVGFIAQEVTVTGATTKINIKLRSDQKTLDEVIVVGYGVQKRREVTGAITKVNAEAITSIPTPSFEASLQGRAAGVQVTQGSGLAGSASVVRIRGAGSISAGGDPLYVIDGVPVTQDPFINGNRGGMNQNPLAAINPDDIESVEVLKDAGAAGIYGSRGSNGVILVTTKRGKKGKPTFNFSTKLGASTYAAKPDFVTGSEWLTLRQEAWENDGNTGLAPLPGNMSWANAQNNNTDWWKETTETGFITQNNLSFNFGTDKLTTYAGVSYDKENSYLAGNGYGRFGVKGTLDYKFSPKVKASLSTQWSRGQNNRVAAAWSGGLGDAMSTALPIYPIFNTDGSWYKDGANPVRTRENTDWRTVDKRSITTASVNYNPVKDLTLTWNGGFDYADITEDKYTNPELLGRQSYGKAERWPSWTSNYNTSVLANYVLNPNENHKFTFTGGAEVQYSIRKQYNSITLDSASTPFYKDPSIIFTDSKVNKSYPTELIGDRWSFVGYFARINYTLNNKYVFQLTGRVDGSSKFGSNNQYGFFPAASAAWILSEEEFLKSTTWIDALKLRASYGITGNSNIPSNQWRGTYQPATSDSYDGNPVIYPTNLQNPDLKWETSNNFDLGLDYSFLQGRITGELSYYNKLSKDVLINRSNAPSTGFDNFWQNIGKIRNYGFELSLNTINIKTKDFTWSSALNIASNSNKVLDLGGLSSDAVGGGTNDTRVVEGYPVGTNYLVRFSRVDPTDGLPIWLDKNGNETKTFSLDNRVVAGKVTPDAFGGFQNTFKYKGFELSCLFNFSIGGNIYDGSAKRQLGVVTDWTFRTEIGDRWQKPGDVAKFPKLTTTTNTYSGLPSEWQYNSTMFLYDASYVRLRELTLAYYLPNSTQKKLGINNTKIFLTGFNLLTFTKYPGGDPEIARDFENAQDRNMSPNVTYLTPPQQKSLTLGLSFGF